MKIIEGEFFNQIVPEEKTNITDGSTYADVWYVPKTVTLEQFITTHWEEDMPDGDTPDI